MAFLLMSSGCSRQMEEKQEGEHEWDMGASSCPFREVLAGSAAGSRWQLHPAGRRAGGCGRQVAAGGILGGPCTLGWVSSGTCAGSRPQERAICTAFLGASEPVLALKSEKLRALLSSYTQSISSPAPGQACQYRAHLHAASHTRSLDLRGHCGPQLGQTGSQHGWGAVLAGAVPCLHRGAGSSPSLWASQALSACQL